MPRTEVFAPGWPGIPARWTSSAKSGLGTAVSRDGHVWFTLSHGILNEIYYPRVDRARTRDLGFIVTDGRTYFPEEKRDARSETSQVALGVPAYQIRNTAVDGRYRIEKEVLTDPFIWRFNNNVRIMPARRTLRVETLARAVVHWSVDGWRTARDTLTHDTTLGVHVADLATTRVRRGDRVDFTFYWREVDRWEGTDFLVCVE